MLDKLGNLKLEDVTVNTLFLKFRAFTFRVASLLAELTQGQS
jgi:hypothetical protein